MQKYSHLGAGSSVPGWLLSVSEQVKRHSYPRCLFFFPFLLLFCARLATIRYSQVVAGYLHNNGQSKDGLLIALPGPSKSLGLLNFSLISRPRKRECGYNSPGRGLVRPCGALAREPGWPERWKGTNCEKEARQGRRHPLQ